MKLAVAVTVAALGVAACQTEEERAASEAELQQLIAARQGAEVDRICFSQQINGWSPLGRDAVLIRKSVNDWYKLSLSGTCQPEWAFNTIAIRSRPTGSSCLTRGDRLTTDDRTVPGVCFIDAIHEWDEDAPVGRGPGAARARRGIGRLTSLAGTHNSDDGA
jgi:hypothetical protein